MAETKELAGVLFRVAEPKSERHPTFSGNCLIDGRRFWIAGWGRTIRGGERAGERFLSLAFTPADEPEAAPDTSPSSADEDIPF